MERDGTVEVPIYWKFKHTDESHATPLFGISCNEGWCESIVCTGMYEWTADWLVEILQGQPFAPKQRPDGRGKGETR